MIWLRNRLRAWLGMRDYDRATELLKDHVDDLDKLLAGVVAYLTTIQHSNFDTRINTLECRTDPKLGLVEGRLTGLDIVTQAHADELIEIRKVAGEMRTALHQLNEVREAIEDPKHRPVIAKTMRQYRALMEQEL